MDTANKYLCYADDAYYKKDKYTNINQKFYCCQFIFTNTAHKSS